MPSASPVYNFNTNEIDCPYRIPSIEAHPNGYDSLQSLSAMADQSFAGIFSSPSPSFSSHPVTSYHSTQTVTSSSVPYCSTTTDYTNCMYNNHNLSQHGRRFCDNSSDDSSFQECMSKKDFHSSRDDIYQEGDQLLSWTRKHPENWNSEEVLDWLIYTGQEKGLDMSELRAEAFQNIRGIELCQMTVEGFTNLEPKYGKALHDMLRSLLSGSTYEKPNELATSDLQELSPFNGGHTISSPIRQSFNSSVYQTMATRKPEMASFNGYNTEMYWKSERQESAPCEVLDMGSYDFDVTDHPVVPQPNAEHCEYDTFIPGYPSATPMRTPCYYPSQPFPTTLPRRRPGRPRNKSLTGDEDHRSHKEKKVKNQHLWEFIYDCLVNPAYNPQYLRWENQRDGVFRFVQSEAVAQLWGGFKNNENMTYEKLSRAMRHYYKRGILERVEGRRLVYKFSRKAMDRAREKRHISS